MKTKKRIVEGKNGQKLVEWFGIPWALQTDEVTAAESVFANYDLLEKHGLSVSRAEVFWFLVDWYWGAHSSKKFIRHPWAERMTELACEYNWLAISGSASCVRGDTRIPNPITGEEPTIKDLCDNGIMPVVMTMKGPALGGVPFLKGKADLYRVDLRSGRSFVATLDHLVLSEHGFVPVSSLNCGHLLVSIEPTHRGSISGNDSSNRPSNALNFRRKVVGFPDDYPACFHFGDEPPRTSKDTFQSFSPLPAYVPECKEHTFVCLDDLDTKRLHNHPCRYAFPRTNEVISCLSMLCRTNSSISRFESGNFSRALDSFRHVFPFEQETNLHRITSEEVPCFGCRQNFSTFLEKMEEHDVVSRVTYAGHDYFYDIQVPVHHHYFAEGVFHHNSGKSQWGAMWGLVNWMVYPEKTKILVTSTTMKDAQKRIWGDVREFYFNATDKETGRKGVLPGKYLHSFGQIRTNVYASDDTASDKCGMELIPAGQSKETQAIGRLIGIKSDHRLIVIGDELPELGMSLLEASQGNLAMNPRFQFIGLGNHASWLDPFGVLATPKDGIKSVSVEDEGWETEHGYCLHLDGPKSPNFDQDKDIWPIYGRKHKKQHERLHPNSIAFWRMCRSFPPVDAEAGQIYSEIEIITNGGVSKPHWRGSVIKLAFLDPGFTTGGDRCQAVIGDLGTTVQGKRVLAIAHTCKLTEDVTNKEVPINFQLARQYIALCKSHGVEPQNSGIDSTGAGIPFADIVASEWSPKMVRVCFGGDASTMIVSETDQLIGTDAYGNRVSELWYQGLNYIRSSQIMGLTTSMIREMCARRYETSKKGEFLRVKVEPKDQMKKRTGKSPDEADAFFGLLEVARQRHGFFPDGFGQALKEEQVEKEKEEKVTPPLQDFDCLCHAYADPEEF